MTDNTTAVACIKNQGTLRSLPLLDLSRKILEFCLEEKITPVMKHLPGYLNVLADQESRLFPVSTEWGIDPTTFKMVWNRFAPKGVKACELFATRFNNHLEEFVSPFPDDLAVGTNAFSIPWNKWDAVYLFPPIACMGEVMANLKNYKGGGVLIAPMHTGAPWFTNLLDRAKEHMRLPASHTLSQVTSRGRVFHNNPSRFQLAAWKL